MFRKIAFLVFSAVIGLSASCGNEPESIDDVADSEIRRLPPETFADLPQNIHDVGESGIRRLPPEAFADLPQNIVRHLQAGGYTIPQTYEGLSPHNVIHGQFSSEERIDWAVLCSKDEKSSIMIFWGGSEEDISEIAKGSVRNSLQGIGGEEMGYSRRITVVGKEYILEHYQRYGGPEPPPITHAGIDNAFLGKASVVHYFHNGKWLRLTGAD